MGTYYGQLVVEGLSADGASDSWGHRGGIATLWIGGTFGGGTVTVQSSPNGTTWFNVPASTSDLSTAISATSDAMLNVDVGQSLLRVSISGSTSPDVDVYYSPNPVINQA